MVRLSVDVCNGYSKHDYETIEQTEESTTFECQRCGAAAIMHHE